MKQRSSSIVASFLHWYFVYNPLYEIVPMGRNFLLWGWKMFSIGYLLPKLFAPWHKDLTSYGRGFDLRRWAHSVGWNLISRIIGAFLRLVVVLAGIVVEAFLFCFFLFLFVFWYVLIVFVVFLLIFGVVMIISPGV